jgi:hypothetical protein
VISDNGHGARDKKTPSGWSLLIIYLHHPCELKINQQANKVADLGIYIITIPLQIKLS